MIMQMMMTRLMINDYDHADDDDDLVDDDSQIMLILIFMLIQIVC